MRLSMSNRKMLMIVNPRAGKMVVKSHMIEIIDMFCAAGYEVNVQTTQCAGDAVRIASGVSADVDKIVCCGGDGTLNETITGLLRSDANIPVGYIPCGTTNDMAKSLGLPVKIADAANVVLNGTPVPHDLGLIDGERFFTYITAFGVFTRASYATPQKLKNTFGHFAYVMDGAKELTHLVKYRTKVTIDGESIEDDFIYGAVSNSVSFAGLFKFPEKNVDLHDGRFEVLLIKKPTNPKALTDLYLSLQKRRFDDKNIVLAHAGKVTFETAKELTWTIDGESGKPTKKVCVENMHGRVSIIR